MLLKDKICVITGAASSHSIGRATAILLAENGAKIAVLDVHGGVVDAAAALAEQYPASGCMALQCDITSQEECEAARDAVIARFGRVDALIHSAGIMKPAKYNEISPAEYELVMGVNLRGTFNIVTAFATTMAAQKSGSIVNVASVAAQRGGGLFGGAHYAASKGGVLSLTRTLARELGSANVRVNAICPSLIATDFVSEAMSADRLDELSTAIPLGRPGRPEEVAGACMFLASDLSTYMTGATLDVNGGIHIH
ncbi:oxidoreductase [Rhizobium wenxiniae]|uniref:NAD(P)-dependent dehydrogenase (Short-subunit alcohol dehydrogenase family) n=1 Tax=Rhizobium wenxiniae TaxID=1737357 RepID=A0A7W9YBB8_9HYPH|nr:SDR family NAD(P)-dependent oxidoreductase [Rhizobium wenxiniae]MBB6165307.1 NAD(P)-dependent dehydrogenase (short-subunit alcohol dehydrogenase family) [Rhizobium wenxiniae]GGG14393.1 oxidoreductase [Rhizobium wenxiniae]